MRKTAREAVFKIVFASRFIGDLDDNLKKAIFSAETFSDDDREYAERVLSVISNHESDFSEILDKHSYAFPEERIFPADKSILYVALAEINYMEDIPDIVSVNEAANIASKYSSEKSASFISGILSEIIKEKKCTN